MKKSSVRRSVQVTVADWAKNLRITGSALLLLGMRERRTPTRLVLEEIKTNKNGLSLLAAFEFFKYSKRLFFVTIFFQH